MELLEGLVRFRVRSEADVRQAEVVDGLHAVRFDADGFEVHLLRSEVVLLHEEAVALVHERLRVVPIVAHGHVCVVIRLLVVPFKEVDEAQVHRRHGFQLLAALLEGLEHVDGRLELLVAHMMERLLNLHLRRQPLVVLLQLVDDPVVSLVQVTFLQLRGNELGERQDHRVRVIPPAQELQPQAIDSLLAGCFRLVDVVKVVVVVRVIRKAWDGNAEGPLKASAHPVGVAEGKVAEDEIESGLEVRHLGHDGFVALNRILVLPQADEGVSNVPEDLEAQLLARLRNLVQRLAVHFDGLVVFSLLVVDVPHVHLESACLRILVIPDDDAVGLQSLVIQAVLMVAVCQIEGHGEGQVQVDLVRKAVLFSMPAQGSLFLMRFLGLLQGSAVLSLDAVLRSRLDQAVHLLLHRSRFVVLGHL
mmetsp:Transcript_1870/g.8312  ORF Transcript_1870/g.8312 Transcript_1870/m.8312 type:complete len:418 (-) Transcript_1870:97-1350(-)